MTLRGVERNGGGKKIEFQISARNGDGLYIPCTPSILMAKKLARSEITVSGAFPCIEFIHLDEYLEELPGLNINW